MALDTYANLQTAIVTWAMRTGDAEFTAAVPDMITLAESRMNRELRLAEMETTVTLSPTASVCTLPAGYVELRSVTALTTPPVVMHQVTRTDLTEAAASGTSSEPRFYILRGDKLTIVPTGSHDVRVEYYARIPALTNSVTTNFLLTKAPELYLYGALIEAAPFMMDDPRLAAWGQLYEQAKGALMASDKVARFGQRPAMTQPPTR
jgi:hypothetical protein